MWKTGHPTGKGYQQKHIWKLSTIIELYLIKMICTKLIACYTNHKQEKIVISFQFLKFQSVLLVTAKIFQVYLSKNPLYFHFSKFFYTRKHLSCYCIFFKVNLNFLLQNNISSTQELNKPRYYPMIIYGYVVWRVLNNTFNHKIQSRPSIHVTGSLQLQTVPAKNSFVIFR